MFVPNMTFTHQEVWYFAMGVGRGQAEGKQLSDARIYDWEFSHNIFCANCQVKYIIYNC